MNSRDCVSLGMLHRPDRALPSPQWSDESNPVLQLESTLQNLPLCQLAIETDYTGADLAQIFEQHPLVPGATLTEQGRFVGMISRHRLLELLIRPHGADLFLNNSLRVLYSYARTEVLRLSIDTPILTAAQQALRRSPELLGEPILVQADLHRYYLLDVHALNIAYWQLRGIETQVRYERTQTEMIQSDKMASLGRLVDGIAHEILDPVSFIWGNLSHVSAYCQDLLGLLEAYERVLPQPPDAILRQSHEIELDYLRQDLPQAIESIRSGADRLSKLATSLQNFCHIDEIYPKPADLHELIDSILLLLKSRLSSEIRVIRNYGYLPPVPCYPGLLNQVLINILSNSVNDLLNQAVNQQLTVNPKVDLGTPSPGPGSSAGVEYEPTMIITTQVCSLPTASGERRWVSICIADNGPSLSEAALQQLIESFSVQQRATKETSLALSYQIVTAKHGGKFEIRSPRRVCADAEPGQTGTEFEILLPL